MLYMHANIATFELVVYAINAHGQGDPVLEVDIVEYAGVK